MKIYRKYLVIGIIFLFVGASVIPSISGSIGKINDIKSILTEDIINAIQTDERKAQTKSNTDWWPMFRHDPGNTGSTTSTGPDTNEILWKETISNEISTATPVICNDRLYIGTGWYYKTLEPPTIMDKSMFEAPDFTEIFNDIFTYNSEYYEGVYCLDANTGTELWDYSLTAPNDPFVANNQVYTTDLNLLTYNSSLYCLDAENGNLNWAKPAGGLSLTPTTGADNKIFLGCLNYFTYECSLRCFNYNGNYMWTYPLPTNEIIYFSAPAYYDGKVYFISTDLFSYEEGKLYCLNADTGQYLWSQPMVTLAGYFGAPSPVCKDGKVFAVEFDYYDYYSYLKCFNANTGSLLWQYPLGFSLSLGTPAVAQNSVFVETTDIYSYSGFLYRISTSGTLIWKKPMPDITFLYYTSSPVCSANKIFYSSLDSYGNFSHLYCMEIVDGDLLWSTYLDHYTVASLSIADGRVYTADITGKIYAFGVLSKIEDAPILKFIDLKAGLLGIFNMGNFKIGALGFSVVLKNSGEGKAYNVTWEMEIKGGVILFSPTTHGDFESIEPDQEEVINMVPVVGFGKPTFKFTCKYKIELGSSKQMVDAGTRQDYVGLAFLIGTSFPEGLQPKLEWKKIDNADYDSVADGVVLSGIDDGTPVPESWKNVRIHDTLSDETVYWNFCKFNADGKGIVTEDHETKGNINNNVIWEVEIPQS